MNPMSWLRFCLLVLAWCVLMTSNFSVIIEFAKQAKNDQDPDEYELGEKKLLSIITPPIAEIMCQKCEGNCGLWVLNQIIFKNYAASMKKIVGAVWELPAK